LILKDRQQQQREDRYRRRRRIIVGKKKDADRSGISTRITGTAHSLSIAGNRILINCPLLETALSATAMIGMIEPIGTIKSMIDGLIRRLGEELQFMIGWGAGSVCMTGLVIVWHIFPGTKRSLKRWPMLEFPMSSYFVGMPIPMSGVKGKSSPIGKAATTSSMVSRRID